MHHIKALNMLAKMWIVDRTGSGRGPHHHPNPEIDCIASAAIARRSAPLV